MAVLTSATACAPITSHTTAQPTQPGSVPNIATCAVDWGLPAPVGTGLTEAKEKLSFTDRLHGLGERLSALSIHRGDSDPLGRNRTGRSATHALLRTHWRQFPKA